MTLMQRILISAAALAACAAPSLGAAASSVTLYGIADVGIFANRVKVDGVRADTAYGLVSGGQSGSRWGLRGSEDLGGGLKFNFQLESGFDLTNGRSGQNSRLFGRAAWGGLSGAFGEVRFGRQQTAAVSYFGSISPFGTSWSNAAIGKSGFRASDTPRFDNTVAYYSPKFGGAQFGASYSFNTRGGMSSTDDSTRELSLAGRYAAGPIYLALTYDRLITSDNDPNANGRDPSAIQLGGSYDFKAAKVYAGWSQQKDGWIKSAEGAVVNPNNDLGSSAYFDGKVNAYLVGVSVPFGASQLLASFHLVDPDDRAFAGGEKVKIYNLGYNYKMSKRTSLYAMVSYHDGSLYSFRRDSDSQQFGIGMRHNF